MEFKQIKIEVILPPASKRIDAGEICDAYDFGKDRILVVGKKDVELCHIRAFKTGAIKLVQE